MNRLKELREERKISLQELQAELQKEFNVKIGRASLNNYERGIQVPKQDTWQLLAKYFHVDAAYIMGLSPIRNKLENYFFEQSISTLVDLVEENNQSAPTIRKMISTFSSMLRTFKDRPELLDKLYIVLSQIQLLDPQNDSLVMNSKGDMLSKKEAFQKILNSQQKAFSSINFFVSNATNAADHIKETLTIEIDSPELNKAMEQENFDFTEFVKNNEKFQKQLDEKITANFKKIDRKRN